MKKTLTLIIGFIIFQTGFTQEQPKSLSLQEAIDYALENNRSAINAARDIEAAKKQKWETTATGLPQIDANVAYTNNIKQQFDAIDFDQDGIVDFGAKQSMNPSITLNQLIFDGSYLVGLQSAKVFLEISENAKTKTDLEVRKAVINAYGNVLLANESVEILKRNVIVLEKNLYETQKIYENGLEEEESVEQLQITLSGLKSNLNKTERLQNIAIQMLNINLGIDVSSNTILTDTLESLTDNNIDLDILNIENNVENTIDYKIANNDKISKELLVKLEMSKALPTLSAYINGAYIANSNDFSYFDKEQRWIGTSAFGVNLNIPIFSSGKEALQHNGQK
eukprot:TRINITY_DN656_c0_g1_i3.p1 TRINITY_DN656_c0_g1~~TRINITY_DN656_c0_g1_i3.p1  ORF type:complete len:338 (-),score=103.68 TRINITY_DN656_c0_g1_i3:308-1321(-)